jgi:hypothetical protein
MDAAEDIQALPTSLQTTDPPSFAVARAAVADGGEGYAAGDALVLSDPPVAVTVSAVDGTGAITAVSFNAGTVYTDDPKGVNIAAGGGSGTGAVFEIRTAYAPGDAQADGELRHVHRSDPLVQASRMRGYIRDSISGSGLAQQVARLEAMRKWSPAYLYAEGDAAYYNGRWYAVTGAASIGEPPGGNPEKWAPVEGGVTGDALAVLESARRIELMWNEMFGNGIVFAYHFDLDFYTLDGAVLEEGVWRADLGRVEV